MKKETQIPKEINEIVELLAEHVHEIWMQGRIKQGWTYGPKRDDNKKQTPCLVPYEELPEEEKEYDRNTALETIKFLLEKGYSIKK
jgi:hypothetical protein